MSVISDAIRELVKMCHTENARWWVDPATGESLKEREFIVPCKLMMIVSEITEAMEGHRKNLPDDKLPHRPAFEVELADALIRIFDLAGAYNVDLGGAFVEKLNYNRDRIDHTHAHRQATGGKAY